ncbi:MAG: hypothetical protein HOP12_07025 [Candidatus Eisenbacteria bacterium]|uniref:Uncharacterized protein n=1 Tax=Eiseniibacteriota bacterium TaxID=2212470 RepID=A0A849SH72_UNCEI|nr:hypothetical protein [Candidatus Eisenbacteria bacterium]
MRPTRILLSLALALFAAGATASHGFAQSPPFVSISLLPQPSYYPADWQVTHTLAEMKVYNPMSEDIECQFRVVVSQDGSSATTTETRRFPNGLNTYKTPQLCNWRGLQFNGAMAKSVARTGHLSESYVFLSVYLENCVLAISRTPVQSVSASTGFLVSVPSPPALRSPAEGSESHLPNPVFSWTPVFMSDGAQVLYRFRLVRVLPGQTPRQAIELNRAEFETITRSTGNFSYPTAAPRLQNDWRYAWRVQSVHGASNWLPGMPQSQVYTPVGSNDGLSEIFAFTWRGGGDPGRAVSNVTASRELDAWGDAKLATITGAGADPRPWSRDRVAGGGRAEATLATDASPALADASRSAVPVWWATMLDADGGQARRSEWFERRAQARELAGATAIENAAEGASAPEQASSTTAQAASTDGGAPVTSPALGGDPNTVPLPTAPDETTSSWAKLIGSVSVSGDVYGHEGGGPSAQPNRNGRMNAGMTLSMLGGRMNLPLDALVSDNRVAVSHSINQFGINPQWAWGGLLAGHFAPRYSNLTLADATVLGGGGEVTRGSWRVGGLSGRVRQSLRADSANAFQGQYARHVNAGRIGNANVLQTAVEVAVMEARDDEGSLPSTDSLTRATVQSNGVLGLRARRMLFDSTLVLQAEGAWSRYRRDLRSNGDNLYGRAVTIQLSRDTPLSGIGGRLDYLNGGFVNLGNAALASDRMESQLNGRHALFNGLLDVSANAGIRDDNLSRTLGARTRRALLGTHLGWRPPRGLGAEFELGWVSGNSEASLNRPELGDVTRNLMFSPRFTWGSEAIAHTISASYSLQRLEYSGDGALELSNGRNTIVVGSYQGIVSRTLTLLMSGSYFLYDLGTSVTETGTAGPGVNLNLFSGRLQSTVQLQFTQTRIGGIGIERELAPTIEAHYQVAGRHSVFVRAGYRRYRVGNPLGSDFDDRQATIEYSAGL